MIIPDSFQLAGLTWSVQDRDDLENLGQTFRDKALIVLQTGMPEQIREATFCHELVHAIKFMKGDTYPHDEGEVEAWAYYLHQYLQGIQIDRPD